MDRTVFELDQARVLIVEAPFPLEVVGRSTETELTVAWNLTFTASASETAERLAGSYAAEQSTPEEATVFLGFPIPENAGVSGRVVLTMPADLDLQIRALGGTAEIEGMNRTLNVQAASHVAIRDAVSDVSVTVGTGNIRLETRALPNTTQVLETQSGDIGLQLPQTVSVSLLAETGAGNLAVTHPEFPPVAQLNRYEAEVRGSLARIVLQTGGGNILVEGP